VVQGTGPSAGPNQPFYGIESPGLEDRQEPDLPLEALASFYLESVRSVQASGPYALGGYSMGGVMAFEMARQLQAQGESVALLAILDAWSPGSHLPFSPNRCASSAALSDLIARRK